ncbi:MAG: Uma2 family endonuclease [Cyanophyceae cyanobacterium]
MRPNKLLQRTGLRAPLDSNVIEIASTMIATSQPTTQKLSWTEYLAYADGSDTRYELVQGDLKPMSLGTGKHGAISEFLSDSFRAHIRQQGLPWTAKQMTVGIPIPRAGRWETSRIPDVTVLTVAQWQSFSDREAVIDYEDPAPLLVVEKAELIPLRLAHLARLSPPTWLR